GLQDAAVEDRGGDAGQQAPAAGGRVEDLLRMQRRLGQVRRQREVRVLGGDGDANRRGGGVQLRLGGQDVRPLAHQAGRQADRDLRRCGQAGEVEIGRGPFRRRLAREQRKLVPRQRQVAFQGRQQRLVL